jgi:dipeptidyl aminopeptidase/acylaminoacyl peptidase
MMMRRIIILAVLLTLLFAAARAQDAAPDATAEAKPAGEIAMSVCKDNSCHIAVMNADGNTLRDITPADQYAYAPQWSPDGKKLLYVLDAGDNHRVLMACDADGSNPVQLGSAPLKLYTFLHWSADGQRLLYASFNDAQKLEYHAVNLNGTADQILQIPIPDLNTFTAAYFDNGDLFIASLGLYRAKSDGSSPQRLTDRLTYPAELSPDKQRILSWSLDLNSYAVSDLDGKAPTPVRNPAWAAQPNRAPLGIGPLGWSPDGQYVWGVVRLVNPMPTASAETATPEEPFTSYTDEVFVARADGSDYHVIQTDDYTLSWSPDSRYITYSVKTGENEYQVFIARPDGSDATQLTSGDDHSQPAWRPAS